jgi:type III secretory pathway component EscV
MSKQVAPVVPVVVELGHELLASPEHDTSQFLAPIAKALAALLNELGIPGLPRVVVNSSPETDRTRIIVNGSLQAYSLELLQRLYQYFPKPDESPVSLSPSWEKEIRKAVPDNVREFVAQLVVQSAKQRLETLLSRKQAAAYLRLAKSVMGQAPDLHPNKKYLETTTNVLKYLLRLGLSIGDYRTIVKYIADGLAKKQCDDDIAETLVSQLNPYTIEIEMNAGYLRQVAKISLADGQYVSLNDSRITDKVREQFGVAANVLFSELGIRIPNIVLIASGSIKEQAFSIKINHIAVCVPRFGLSPDQLLVNATVSYLKNIEKDEQNAEKRERPLFETFLETPRAFAQAIQSLRHKNDHTTGSEKKGNGITAKEAINPANDNEASIISQKDRQAIEKDKGLYVWDQTGYVTLALAKELQQNSWRLLHIEAVEYELAQLHQIFPELVIAAMERISLSQMTRILRELLKEAISIRDLRAILERILTCDYIVIDPIKLTALDDRLAFREQPPHDWRNDPRLYAQYVRIGLKRYITHKLTSGKNVVFALDENIEVQILDHLAAERHTKSIGVLTRTQIEQILAAIRSKVSSQTPAGAFPVILTISEIRAFVRQMVAPEFPDLFVASHDELSADSKIQPIATISV